MAKPKPGSKLAVPTDKPHGIQASGSDTAKYLKKNLELMMLPDIDLKNADEVRERIGLYFSMMEMYECKPTVSGLALSLNGMARQMLWAIVNDQPTGRGAGTAKLPHEVTDLLKKAYKVMETMWEDYVQNGKINPVMGIFLGKNHYGYKDQTEYVLTPNQSPEDVSVEDIKSRYRTELPASTDIDSE